MADTLTTVFIIPYRDRAAHKATLIKEMQTLLAAWPLNSWLMLFAHQCDKRPFNRGAMKNIGFLAVKQRFPTTYKDLTLVFHDVDTYPTRPDLVHYSTKPGVVSHFYGYLFSLGGMFAIKGADFEKTTGFPNFWGWGLEDNKMQDRCLAANLVIDRSCFYNIKSNLIARPFDGYERTLSLRDGVVYKEEQPDSLLDLQKVVFTVQPDSDAPQSFLVNITAFTCRSKDTDEVYKTYDIRNGMFIRTPKGFNRRVWNMKKMF